MIRLIHCFVFFTVLVGTFGWSKAPDDSTAAITRTVDGQEWSFDSVQGKTVLLIFWSTTCGPCKLWEPWLKELYGKHGNRDDFAMIGVSLDASASSVKKYCQEKGIDWLQLHEPNKTWENTLAQTFKVDGIPALWLIGVNGGMKQLAHPEKALVEDAIAGIWIDEKLTPGVTSLEDAERICGKPDSKDGGMGWHYKRTNELRNENVDIFLRFDKDGRYRDTYRQSRYRTPAVLTVQMSHRYWNEQVKSKIDHDLLPENNENTVLELGANYENVTSIPPPPIIDDAGRTYVLRLPPRTYNLCLQLRTKQPYNYLKQIPLRQDLILVDNQELNLRFE